MPEIDARVVLRLLLESKAVGPRTRSKVRRNQRRINTVSSSSGAALPVSGALFFKFQSGLDQRKSELNRSEKTNTPITKNNF